MPPVYFGSKPSRLRMTGSSRYRMGSSFKWLLDRIITANIVFENLGHTLQSLPSKNWPPPPPPNQAYQSQQHWSLDGSDIQMGTCLGLRFRLEKEQVKWIWTRKLLPSSWTQTGLYSLWPIVELASSMMPSNQNKIMTMFVFLPACYFPSIPFLFLHVTT